MLQHFDGKHTDIAVKIEGIDEVPEEMKILADMYMCNAALFIQAVINGQIGWNELLQEQAKLGKQIKTFKEPQISDTWVGLEKIVENMLNEIKKQKEM